MSFYCPTCLTVLFPINCFLIGPHSRVYFIFEALFFQSIKSKLFFKYNRSAQENETYLAMLIHFYTLQTNSCNFRTFLFLQRNIKLVLVLVGFQLKIRQAIKYATVICKTTSSILVVCIFQSMKQKRLRTLFIQSFLSVFL